jgi:hypothetical protein
MFVESRFIIGNNYFKLIDQLKSADIENFDDAFYDNSFSKQDFPYIGKVTEIESEPLYKLNAVNGYNFINKGKQFCGYDETLIKIPCMEGDGYLCAYSLVGIGSKDYVPVEELTFNFYTKSKIIGSDKEDFIDRCDNIIDSSKINYIINKGKLLTEYTPENSILLMDGPMIEGNIGQHIINLDTELLNKNIMPIHVVKNSDSSLIVDNIESYKNKYNSDFHYAYSLLGNGGKRTRLFYYQDEKSKSKNKYFCYIKPFSNVTPVRIEFHKLVYDLFRNSLNSVFDAIYYMLLEQGNYKNPQPRIIAIAERYAKEVINTIDVNKLLMEIGLKPTMNYTRFGW